jgi:hypothetical protein
MFCKEVDGPMAAIPRMFCNIKEGVCVVGIMVGIFRVGFGAILNINVGVEAAVPNTVRIYPTSATGHLSTTNQIESIKHTCIHRIPSADVKHKNVGN